MNASYGMAREVPVASLAKQQEELFQPGKARSLILPRNSPALYLVQRVRDEAHRFAITSHRKQRTRLGMASRLSSTWCAGPGGR